MRYTYFDSPIGPLLLTCSDDARLTGLYLPDGKDRSTPEPDWIRDDGAFAAARSQLGEYFAGERREFDLTLDAHGTRFQKLVWDALTTIPYGQTTSYGKLAASIGHPNAFRAVGAANGQNPISIIVPCHRVIGANGSLTGYGGGLPAKRWLLAHETARTGLFA